MDVGNTRDFRHRRDLDVLLGFLPPRQDVEIAACLLQRVREKTDGFGGPRGGTARNIQAAIRISG